MISFLPASYGQKGKSEISAAYGYWSIYTFVNGKPFSNSSGTGMLNYKYYLTQRFTLGMVFGYENISNWGSFLTFAPEFSYTYLDTKDDRIRIKLYGSGSLGMTVFDDFFVYNDIFSHHKDESGPKVTAHASPFGMRIGRKLAGFVEIGLGYKGLINMGASYRFRTHARVHTEN